MSYTINQLAKLAGVSVRTLHYYDEVGLLRPARVKENGYRQYGEEELLKLQQILFFRELDFPLDEIKRIVASPNFDMRSALRDQRKLIELKQKRLAGLIATIDKTIKKINKEITMDDQELYGSFTKEEMDQYTKEARERWGNTEAFKQSQERVKKMTKEDFKRVQENGDKLLAEIAAHMGEGAKSEVVQKLIAQHYNNLRVFYEPNLKLYRGLADMYVNDPRFTEYFEKRQVGLAQFMKEAMVEFCDGQERV